MFTLQLLIQDNKKAIIGHSLLNFYNIEVKKEQKDSQQNEEGIKDEILLVQKKMHGYMKNSMVFVSWLKLVFSDPPGKFYFFKSKGAVLCTGPNSFKVYAMNIVIVQYLL